MSAAVVISLVLLDRLIPLQGEFTFRTREMVLFSAPLLMSTVFAILLTHVDTLLIGFFKSSFDVGLYSAVYPIATGLSVILASFGYLYLPLASRLDANGKIDEINNIYKITTKWIFILTFPVFLLFVLFPKDILEIFFGTEYQQASTALIILSIGFFSNAAYGRNRETLSALGLTKYIFVANMLAFCLNIFLNVILIPKYGINGAAAASAASYLAMNGIVYVFLKLSHDISPYSRSSIKTFLILPVLLLPIGISVSDHVNLSIITIPAFLISIGGIILIIVIITGCLEHDDVVIVESIENILGLRIPYVRSFIPNNK
jgi:O-antigen/teichoic acid export membrane protein